MKVLSFPGLTPYQKAWNQQLERVEQRVSDQVEDALLIFEHTPVVTRGRGLQRAPTTADSERAQRQMPFDPSTLRNTDYFEVERGGDLTFHGPGQIVIYPIVKLVSHNLSGFLRALESGIIEWLKEFQIEAQSKPHESGVWIGDRKIASLGLAVRSWVTFHGVAINIVNDLKDFQVISPCGYRPDVMTNLKTLAPKIIESWGSDWREYAERGIVEGMLAKL